MKILWLSHFLPYPPKGGALQRSHNLLRQAAIRHEVHLVSLNQRKNLPDMEMIEEAKGFLGNICKSVVVFPIPSDAAKWQWIAMTAINYFRSSPYDVRWLLNREMSKFMQQLAGAETFDLLHVDTIGLYPYIRGFSGTPVVLNHHNIESHMMRRRFENEKNLLNKVYFNRESGKIAKFEREICGNCAVNLVVSELDGHRLQLNAGNVCFTVIPNGVDVEYFQPRKPIGYSGDGLLFAGAMDWYPNREAVRFFLNEIWPKLLAEKPGRRATIVGRNPLPELLEASKISPINAPGFVEDVRPYLDEAGIYVCPIRDGGGTRLKILDALAMGKPLVATALAVEGLDLVDREHYLRAETAEDFVVQIDRLEKDPTLRKALASSGQRFVMSQYSWDVIGEKLDHAYQDVVRSKAAGIRETPDTIM